MSEDRAVRAAEQEEVRLQELFRKLQDGCVRGMLTDPNFDNKARDFIIGILREAAHFPGDEQLQEAVESVQPEPASVKMGFEIRIEVHNDQFNQRVSHPENLKFAVGDALERRYNAQEGVDFSMEVKRTYEQR